MLIINLKDGPNQCVEILDTSGFYQFPAMRELNIKLATAFILVFDLTKIESLQSLIDLRKIISTIKGFILFSFISFKLLKLGLKKRIRKCTDGFGWEQK